MSSILVVAAYTDNLYAHRLLLPITKSNPQVERLKKQFKIMTDE